MNLLTNLWSAPAAVAALVVYWGILRNPRARLLWLSFVSFVALATLHPLFAIVTLVAIWGVYRATEANGRNWAGVTAAAVTGLLVAKYGGDAAVALYGVSLREFFLFPLGISYFAFRIIQYVVDVRRKAITERDLLKLSAFLLFVPTFPAGPLETYQGFYGKRSEVWDSDLVRRGVRRILVGYFKKLFVVEVVFHFLFGDFLASVPRDSASLRPVAFVGLQFLRAYLDLAAYSDIAIGLSALFGFRIQENFLAPFLSRNLGEFWRGWHASLSQWCRNQVYFPVFGWSRRPWLATGASMLAMGMWHRVSLNWAAWAIYHAGGLVAVGHWGRMQKRNPTLRRMAGRSWYRVGATTVTLLYVTLGYSFVAVEPFAEASRLFFTCLRSLWIWG